MSVPPSGPAPRDTGRAIRRLRRFADDRSGSATVLALFLLVFVLVVGGMAVDVLRYEHQRVRLQSTADRAVLAAGSLRQPNDPYDVVAEYFAKEGLSSYLKGVEVDEGLNFRTVSVQTEAIVPAAFMRLVGVKSLTATAAATAEERYSKVEVALVLDLSNSMNSFNRIENLRIAGAQFIETLFANAEADQISVTVVNYTGQVNPGADLAQYYNVSRTQPFSHCVEFGAQDYQSMAMPMGTSLTGSGHFDPWHIDRARNMIFCPTPRLPQWNVNDSTHRENIVMSGDPAFLTDYLEGLWADGNTSIEIGLRWGAAMLDPSSRPIVDDMIARGLVNPAFAGRPLDYDDEETLKAVVLMTDGENWVQYMMRDQFKTGQSDVWHTVLYSQAPGLQAEVNGIINGTITPSDLQRHRFDAVAVASPNRFQGTRPSRTPTTNNPVLLSVRPGNSGQWYQPDPFAENPPARNSWRNTPWTTGWQPDGISRANSCEPVRTAASTGLAFDFIRCNDRVAYRMTWPWLWDNFPVRWVGAYLMAPATSQNWAQFFNSVLFTRSANVKNQHLDVMCDTIKAEDIPIFTVAFEAPPGGVSAMQSCASSLNHFYDVEGTDISTAFRAIAGTINRLRLTQ